jgi:PAS domain S-box-containing protein
MKKTTILIVEDEAIVAADLAGKLGRLGYEVSGIAAAGEKAVSLACGLRPDLVLMDISLEGSMDGIEATEAIRREYDVPVIYLTAHSDPATLSRAKLTGPFGYILKPFEERELATQIELALYKHQADRQLREQREWLRVTLTSIGDAVIATDAAGCITFINPVAESLTGWKVEEAMGRPVQSVIRIVNEHTGEALEEPVARVLREGRSVALANHAALVTKDGRTVPIEDSAAPILDSSGQVIGAVLVFHDVTEKRRDEEALRQAKEEWELTFHAVPDLIAILDTQNRIVRVNRAMADRLGVTPHQCIGLRCYEAVHGMYETPEFCPHALTCKDGRQHVVEVHEPRLGGDFMVSTTPLPDRQGQITGVVHVARDITERKRAEEALRRAHDELDRKVKERTVELTETNRELKREIEERRRAEKAIRESEEKYRIMIKLLPSIVYKGYKDWSIEFFDEKIESLTGYGVLEFHSRNLKWYDVIVKEDIPVLKENFIRALKTDNTYVREYRIKTNSGKILWIQDRGHIVCDRQGQVEYISGVFFDITDRKKQEEQLQKSEKLLQTVFDGISDPLVLLDESLKVRILNHAAMRYFQIEKSGYINSLCCFEGLMGKSAPCEGCQVPELVARRKSSSFERNGVMNPDKLEQITIYRFDEKDPKFGGALMRIHDITEARLMERKMIQNERLASLGLTVSSITHEIANPIGAITFNAPILQDYIKAMISIADKYAEDLQDLELFHMSYPEFKEDALEILENILHASKKINTTVTGLRRLVTKKERLQKQWFNVKPVIERVAALLRIEINQHVKVFEINYSENLPEIYSDPNMIEQILINLLMNAAHAADKKDSRIILDASPGNSWKDHLVIKISDNGCGMDPETLSRIFNPFFSTKAPGQGTGLGLYICQNLVKDLGGRIEVESEAGSGSVFRVVLHDIERRSVRRV